MDFILPESSRTRKNAAWLPTRRFLPFIDAMMSFHLYLIHNALAELQNGVKGMAGITMDISAVKSVESGIEITRDTDIDAEGYCIWEAGGILNLKASDAKGVLYGVFCILRQIAMEKALQGIHISCRPDNPLRMYNHWDNMDGSIERGYSGASFFFQDNDL